MKGVKFCGVVYVDCMLKTLEKNTGSRGLILTIASVFSWKIRMWALWSEPFGCFWLCLWHWRLLLKMQNKNTFLQKTSTITRNVNLRLPHNISFQSLGNSSVFEDNIESTTMKFDMIQFISIDMGSRILGSWFVNDNKYEYFFTHRLPVYVL